MYHGALATDIKKSSTNWSTFPDKMFNWVDITNQVTEKVFNDTKKNEIEQLILPNSPEGDAYTFYYKSSNKSILVQHLKEVATKIQLQLQDLRNKNILSLKDKREALKNIITEENIISLYPIYKKPPDYLGTIYLRIGIAVSDKAPYSYKYNSFTSYRGGVISMAEKAEEKAPYEEGYGLYNEGKIEKKKNENVEFEFYNENEFQTGKVKKNTNAGGLIAFVSYKFGITDEMVQKQPNLLEYKQDEFKKYHEQANKLFSLYQGKLVKVKRDSSSMYYIPPDMISRKNGLKQEIRSLFQGCCHLCSTLPKGSGIGLCFGNDLTEIDRGVTREGKNTTVKDYFGKVVNLAARMEFTEWSYETSTGVSVKNSHGNRVAFASETCEHISFLYWGVGKNRCKSENNASSKKGQQLVDYPFTVDKIPLKNLNAGETGHLYVLSRKVEAAGYLQQGAKVSFKLNSKKLVAEIVEMETFTAKVKTKSDGQVKLYRVPLKLLEQVRQKTKEMENLLEEIKRENKTQAVVKPLPPVEFKYNSSSDEFTSSEEEN